MIEISLITSNRKENPMLEALTWDLYYLNGN